MLYDSKTPDEYISDLPEERKEAVSKLREIILRNLPEGFEEIMFGMLGYVVPLRTYPKGYHTTPGEPLPFMGLASQKNHIALYHMGVYFAPEVKAWFVEEYAKRVPTKLDMGKSCIRFRNPKNIPYDLIAELCMKISMEDYIIAYEESLEKLSKKR